jgi:hypothetical protein
MRRDRNKRTGNCRDGVASVVMKWKDHPNLRLRPHSPNKGRGRLQRQIARAFMVGGPELSATQIYDWCFTRRRQTTTLKLVTASRGP